MSTDIKKKSQPGEFICAYPMPKKKVLFYLGHPAHYHLFKNTIKEFGIYNSIVLIKSKDVLEKLLIEDGIPYTNVDDVWGRNQAGKTFSIATKFFKRILKIGKIIKQQKPDLLVSSGAEHTILGKYFGIPSFVFYEDDIEIAPTYAYINGNLCTNLICPEVCSAWKWKHKKIGYNSYHELAYLHTDHFTPDWKKVESIFEKGRKHFIIRFSELGAYHDVGKTGITDELALTIIKRLETHGKIYITSERELPAKFEPYRIAIKATDIHHALYYAEMFIGDSQTMTAESAVLGTPALRFNDFVGVLSYLEELEHSFGLTYGFKTNNPEGLLSKLDELLKIPDIKAEWKIRREKMLKEKINLAKWMYDFLWDYSSKNKKH